MLQKPLNLSTRSDCGGGETTSRLERIRIVLLAVSCFTLASSVWRGEGNGSDLETLLTSEAALRAKVEQLASESDRMASEIHKISASSAYARKVLRDRYHLTDEGEVIIFFAE